MHKAVFSVELSIFQEEVRSVLNTTIIHNKPKGIFTDVYFNEDLTNAYGISENHRGRLYK